jgi:hypothetical protein
MLTQPPPAEAVTEPGTDQDVGPGALAAEAVTEPRADQDVGPGAPAVEAVIVDLAYPPATATVVVRRADDGLATVAASTGGVVTRPTLEGARVLDAAAATLHLVPPVTEVPLGPPGTVATVSAAPPAAVPFPLPPVGYVAFHVLTADGGHTRTVAEAELRSLDHPLTLLFSAVQAVLGDLRPR